MAGKREEEDDDRDSGVQEAIERDVEKVRKATSEDDDRVTEPERDDTDDDDEPEETPTRDERKRNRYREAQERADRAEREIAELKAQQQQLMQQQMFAMQQQRQPEQPQVPFEKQYEDTEMELIRHRQRYSQVAQAYNNAGRDMPEEEMLDFVRRNRELEQRKADILNEDFIRRNNLRPNVDPGVQQAQLEFMAMRAANIDVFNHAGAEMHFRYAYNRMRHVEGKPDSSATVSAAIEEARRTVLKKGSAPSQASRSKYTGQSTGAGGPAREQQGGVVRVQMTKAMKRMADNAFPHIKDDKRRYEHWYKTQYAQGERSKARQA